MKWTPLYLFGGLLLLFAILAGWYHGKATRLAGELEFCRARLAALELEQAAYIAAENARTAAEKANAAKAKENAQKLAEIRGADVDDDQFFRALDRLLHQQADSGADSAARGIPDRLPAAGGQ